jgi:hypothetical protein
MPSSADPERRLVYIVTNASTYQFCTTTILNSLGGVILNAVRYASLAMVRRWQLAVVIETGSERTFFDMFGVLVTDKGTFERELLIAERRLYFFAHNCVHPSSVE